MVVVVVAALLVAARMSARNAQRTHARACMPACCLPARPTPIFVGGGEGGWGRGGGRRERGAERGGEEVEWREGTCGSNDWRIPPPTPQLWPWMDGVGGGEKAKKKRNANFTPPPPFFLPSFPAGARKPKEGDREDSGKISENPTNQPSFFPRFQIYMQLQLLVFREPPNITLPFTGAAAIAIAIAMAHCPYCRHCAVVVGAVVVFSLETWQALCHSKCSTAEAGVDGWTDGQRIEGREYQRNVPRANTCR